MLSQFLFEGIGHPVVAPSGTQLHSFAQRLHTFWEKSVIKGGRGEGKGVYFYWKAKEERQIVLISSLIDEFDCKDFPAAICDL